MIFSARVVYFQFFVLKCLENSEYDQEIPQSQTADNHVAPRGRAAQPSRDTRGQFHQQVYDVFLS